MLLVGEELKIIADSDLFGESLHNAIIKLLMSESFSPQVSNLADNLKVAILLMESYLLNNNRRNLTIKIARECAERAGYAILQSAKFNEESRLLFESALISILYILYVRDQTNKFSSLTQLYSSYEDLKQTYTQDSEFPFDGVDDIEERKLFQFNNFMKIALLLVPNPKFKRKWLIEVITRVAEHRRQKGYITGSGMSNFTRRRVIIYNRESGVSNVATTSSNNSNWAALMTSLSDTSITGSDAVREILEIITDSGDLDREENLFQEKQYLIPCDNPNLQAHATEIFFPSRTPSLARIVVTSQVNEITGQTQEIFRTASISRMTNNNTKANITEGTDLDLDVDLDSLFSNFEGDDIFAELIEQAEAETSPRPEKNLSLELDCRRDTDTGMNFRSFTLSSLPPPESYFPHLSISFPNDFDLVRTLSNSSSKTLSRTLSNAGESEGEGGAAVAAASTKEEEEALDHQIFIFRGVSFMGTDSISPFKRSRSNVEDPFMFS